nr:bifunctional nuclease domain-containing protein [Tanacetum cinerariifolium]
MPSLPHLRCGCSHRLYLAVTVTRPDLEDADLHLALLINTHIGCDESAGAGFKTEILRILAGQVTTLAAMANPWRVRKMSTLQGPVVCPSVRGKKVGVHAVDGPLMMAKLQRGGI